MIKRFLKSRGWIRDAGVVGFLRIKAWACGEEELQRLLREGLNERDLRCFALQYWTYATVHFLKNDPLNDLRVPLEKLIKETMSSEEKAEERAKQRARELLDGLRQSLTEVKVECECRDMEKDWKDFVERLREHFEDWRDRVKGEVEEYVLDEARREFPEIFKDARSLDEVLEGAKSGSGGSGEKVLKKFVKKVEKVAKYLQKISDSINELLENVQYFSYQYKRLGAYYFNKGQVNNPKGRDPKRLLKFHEVYVEPAMGLLRGEKAYTGDDYTCTFCGESFSVPKAWRGNVPFTEGDFAPLGVSKSKFSNYFYDGNIPHKCPVCQLMLLCSFAGFNRKPWQLRDIEGTDHIFVHMPDLESTYRTNETFSKTLKAISKGTFEQDPNLYLEAVKAAITSVKRKSSWILQNVLFVEIKPTPSKQGGKPKLTYFNIDKGMATVFDSLSDGQKDAMAKALNTTYVLNNTFMNLGTEVIKRLLNRASLKGLIFPYFKDYLEGRAKHSALWWMITLEHLTNQARKRIRGGKPMNVKEIYKRLWVLRSMGEEVLPQIDLDKRRRIGQRFIGLIRGGRKEEFYNELIRLFVVYEEKIPYAIFSLLTEEDHLTFQEKALAFLTGFVSPSEKEDKNEKEVVQNEA
ncbi:MAG: type I-B CRISPR-associated protein Cas8b1/Cst1 [Thermotogae bacterium]|nr:type I-B CRISPR-associated protein Cas8b1/Cst1 [Thermotogota bacterium]